MEITIANLRDLSDRLVSWKRDSKEITEKIVSSYSLYCSLYSPHTYEFQNYCSFLEDTEQTEACNELERVCDALTPEWPSEFSFYDWSLCDDNLILSSEDGCDYSFHVKYIFDEGVSELRSVLDARNREMSDYEENAKIEKKKKSIESKRKQFESLKKELEMIDLIDRGHLP